MAIIAVKLRRATNLLGPFCQVSFAFCGKPGEKNSLSNVGERDGYRGVDRSSCLVLLGLAIKYKWLS